MQCVWWCKWRCIFDCSWWVEATTWTEWDLWKCCIGMALFHFHIYASLTLAIVDILIYVISQTSSSIRILFINIDTRSLTFKYLKITKTYVDFYIGINIYLVMFLPPLRLAIAAVLLKSYIHEMYHDTIRFAHQSIRISMLCLKYNIIILMSYDIIRSI